MIHYLVREKGGSRYVTHEAFDDPKAADRRYLPTQGVIELIPGKPEVVYLEIDRADEAMVSKFYQLKKQGHTFPPVALVKKARHNHLKTV
ncbi:TPA: hypothetical protein ACGW8R_003343 [Pseudomonas aeruginosa]